MVPTPLIIAIHEIDKPTIGQLYTKTLVRPGECIMLHNPHQRISGQVLGTAPKIAEIRPLG